MKKIIQVEMLVNTVFGGRRLLIGDKIEVPEVIGQGWAKRGIAALIPGQDQEDAIDLGSLTAKQLFDMCVEKGIETEPKLSKEAYIALLKEEE